MDIPELKYRTNDIQDEIIKELHSEGPLLTSELRENIGKERFPEGSKGHHPNKLEQWGLIKVIAREGPHDERRFRLTGLGAEYYDRVLAGPVSDVFKDVGSDPELEDRVDELEVTVRAQAGRLERLEEEKLDASRFEALTERLDGEWKDHLIEKVTARLE